MFKNNKVKVEEIFKSETINLNGHPEVLNRLSNIEVEKSIEEKIVYMISKHFPEVPVENTDVNETLLSSLFNEFGFDNVMAVLYKHLY